MFTGIYRDSAGVFCRENPVIFIDFPCNPPAICKYYRFFPADISKKNPQSPCKSLQTFAVCIRQESLTSGISV
jgi:hypothetical protein